MFDWALEADAPRRVPVGFMHWERAVVLLRRCGVPRAFWPAPFEVHPAAGAARQVDEVRRRALLKQCAELRCREHLYFSQSELNDARVPADLAYAVVGPPATPRRLITEDAVYVHGEDAAALLVREDLLPSNWPAVYELAEGMSEPGLVRERADGIRRLFVCEPGAKLFVLKHQLDPLCPTARNAAVMHAYNQAIRSANESVEHFNREMAARYRGVASGFPDANVGGQPREPGAAAPVNIETVAARAVDESHAETEKPSTPAKHTHRWHRDTFELMRTLGPVAARDLFDALARRSDYERRRQGEKEYLVDPDGNHFQLQTVRNIRSELLKLLPSDPPNAGS
jgi:hypothetical protein